MPFTISSHPGAPKQIFSPFCTQEATTAAPAAIFYLAFQTDRISYQKRQNKLYFLIARKKFLPDSWENTWHPDFIARGRETRASQKRCQSSLTPGFDSVHSKKKKTRIEAAGKIPAPLRSVKRAGAGTRGTKRAQGLTGRCEAAEIYRPKYYSSSAVNTSRLWLSGDISICSRPLEKRRQHQFIGEKPAPGLGLNQFVGASGQAYPCLKKTSPSRKMLPGTSGKRIRTA